MSRRLNQLELTQRIDHVRQSEAKATLYARDDERVVELAAVVAKRSKKTAAAERTAAPPPEQPSIPEPLSHAEAHKIFVGLMLAVFLAALNQTIVATALPTMGRYFDDFENLSWIVTAYLLTSTAVAPLFGKLSDIHGRRAMLLTCIGVFMAGSVACAVAPNMLMLILGRGLQGLGGGGILPVAQAIMADSIAPRERGRYQAYMGIVWVTSGVGGPILGGVLSEHLHWSLIFWLNVPLCLAAALMTHTRLKLLPRHERPHKLDVLGAGLMMASAVLLLLALNWGGTRYAWTSLPVVALIAAAGLFSLAFAWRLTHAPEPFLPMSVLANPVMRMGTAANSFSMGASIGLTIYVPLYYEVVHHLSASDSGFALIPLALTTPGSILSGRAMMHMQHYKRVPMVSLVLGLVALALLVWQPALPLAIVIALMAVVGFAVGTVFPICTVSIQNAVPHYQVGVAMGAMNFFRALASAFAVAIMGAIILVGIGVTPEHAVGAGTGSALVAASQQGTDVSFVFRWVFAAGFAFLAAALATLILMQERPLRGRAEPAVPMQAAE